MSNSFGSSIKVSIFGESHGKGIGIVIDGIPPGTSLDMEEIKRQMARRAPGQKLGTPRKETDEVTILSGFYNGYTTGTPLCGIIENKNTRSGDYDRTARLLRPSHADYTAHVKYKGFEDYRGGGHFSGRITAPLTFAGAIFRQLLEKKGIIIASHIKQLHSITDRDFNDQDFSNPQTLGMLQDERLPVLTPGVGNQMEARIEEARMNLDSVGGIVETVFINLPPGLGDPFFESLESRLAQMIFSIPAVKGLSFGAGFDFPSMTGSQANDSFCLEGEDIKTRTNNNGGILGGISTGMPVVFKTVFKPTPSISKKQETVNMDSLTEESIEIHGRHDPCVILRAIPALEAAAAIAVFDAWKEWGYSG